MTRVRGQRRGLARAIGGAKITWYDGDHYALIKRFFECSPASPII